MKTVFFLSFIFVCSFMQAAPKPLNKVKIKVEAAGVARQNTIASFDLSSYTPVPAGSQIVVKTADGQTCLSQVDQCPETKTATLYWRIDGQMGENDSRHFTIEVVTASTPTPVMNMVKDRAGNLILKMNNKDVLKYNTAPPSLPGGVDSVYLRNGFIHPAWSPAGNILTNLCPIDHWHHLGIWNPWTMVEYDGRIYDLWNIGDKQGTVRFDSLYHTAAGSLYTAVLARHRHVIYEPQKEQLANHTWGTIRFTPKHEKIIMDELQHIRVWNVEEGVFIWDLDFSLSPCAPLPIAPTVPLRFPIAF